MAADQAPAGWLELFVPGRLCLFGEHSDWAGQFRKYNSDIVPGRTLVVGTEQGLYARARPLERPVLVLRSTTDEGERLERELPLSAEPLVAAAQEGEFWAYAAGVAYRLLVDFGVGGLELDNYQTTLPLRKGLSSSAALCVLVARAFSRTYGLRLTTRGEMQYAYDGERMTPSQCGKMDQAVAFGKVPVCMSYDGDALHVVPASLAAPLHMVLVDLRASKDTVAILEGLQSAYPHPTTPTELRLVELLGEINQRLTGQALEAMASGDVARLGALMSEAQRHFDERAAPLCPEQLASPALHRLLGWPALQPLVHGAKGVGSQGDGTAQLLCRGPEAQAEAARIVGEELGMHAITFTVPATSSEHCLGIGGTLAGNADSTAAGALRALQRCLADLEEKQRELVGIHAQLAALHDSVTNGEGG